MWKYVYLIATLVISCGFVHGVGNGPEREVATRAQIADALHTSFTQAMSRSGHISRKTISSLRVAVPNVYLLASSGELGPGAPAEINASIEYPAGVCTPLKFNNNSGAIVADASIAFSDYVAVAIPNGATFWVRQFVRSPGGVMLTSFNNNTDMGDALTLGTTGAPAPDQTVNCTAVANSQGGGSFSTLYPLAIVARISGPSVCILGDSIAIQSSSNALGDGGAVMPSIGPSFGYISLAVSSDAASLFVSTSRPVTLSMLQFCSAGIVEYGRNDLDPGNLATVQANLSSVYNSFTGGQQVFQTTITPISTSTDNWATIGNQTIVATSTNSFNASLRTASFGPANGFFDVASVVETSTISGIWKATGVAYGYVNNDGVGQTFGIHPSAFADGQIQTAGVIDVSRITKQ